MPGAPFFCYGSKYPLTDPTDPADPMPRTKSRPSPTLKPPAPKPSAVPPPADRRDEALPDGWAPLTVATWNIHSCVGLDARFAPERTAKVIRSLDVDLIGLQEVGWHHRGEIGIDQFALLQETTGYAAIPGPTKHDRAAHYGNAVLTRLPVLAVEPLDLSLPIREPRGALAVTVAAAGRPVRVVVAHLGLDPWERNAQVTRILDFLDSRLPLPTIFMGDLNEWRPTAPRLRRLFARLPDCAAPRSFHARLPTLRLDRIFVSADLRLAGFDVVRNALTRRASDHLPVRALVGVPAVPKV